MAERYLYDAAGRLSVVRYENGLQTTYVYDANDNLLSAQTGAAPALPASEQFSTGAGEAVSYETPGADRDASTGYGLLTTESGASPYGFTLIRYSAPGALQSEAGLPAIAPTTRARVVIDRSPTGSGVDTGIVLVNPSSSDARVNFLIRNPDGSEHSSGSATLAAGSHRSLPVSQLSGIASGMMAPAASGGSLEIESETPIAVAALRLAANARGDLLLSAALTADLNLPRPNGPVHIPHLADGGGFTTALHLANPAVVPVSGRIEFFDDEGRPLPVGAGAGEPTASMPYSIAAGGVLFLETDGARPTTAGGWARITPTEGEAAPIASGVFHYTREGMAISGSNIPAAQPAKLARAYADQSGGRETVIALTNPGEEAAVVLRAYALDGVSEAAQPTVVLLPAGGHRAVLASAAFPDLPREFKGVIEIAPTTPVAAVSFRLVQNERGDPVFAGLPVADMTQPAPAPVIFPHIVDGGGFQSEIIVLSPAESIHVLRFLGPDGSPIDAAR